MIEWTDGLEIGSTIEEVKNSQPEYLKVDWDHSHVIDSVKWFEIIYIKGNQDLLRMQNFLSFDKDGYAGRESMK